MRALVQPRTTPPISRPTNPCNCLRGNAHNHAEWRTRTDKIAVTGTVSLRYAGKLRHLRIGRARRTTFLMLIHDRNVITSHAETGEVLTEHHIDPDRDHQRPTRPLV